MYNRDNSSEHCHSGRGRKSKYTQRAFRSCPMPGADAPTRDSLTHRISCHAQVIRCLIDAGQYDVEGKMNAAIDRLIESEVIADLPVRR